jgi:integrase/recombinase XerC/integrase/recombinase XerD
LGRGEKPRTTHGHYRGCSAFFHWLEDEEIVLKSPFAKVKPPKVPKDLLSPLTLEEIKLLDDSTNGNKPTAIRNKALVFTLLDTGLRISECLAMKCGDISPDGVFKVIGKGAKTRYVRIGERALKYLKKYMALRNGKPDSKLWIGERGCLTLLGIQEVVEKIGVKAGVNLTCHQFRRTFAVMSLRNGMPITSLQRLLGHESITTTMVYLKLSDSDFLDSHSKFSPVDSLSHMDRL